MRNIAGFVGWPILSAKAVKVCVNHSKGVVGRRRPSLFDCKRTGATPTTHTHTFTQEEEKKKSLRGERKE
jgi:hypothetical protein